MRTQRPTPLLRQNREMASMTSLPVETSRTWGIMEGSAAKSRVTTTGGFGLFFDPGGLPLGRRTTSMLAPSPVLGLSGRMLAAAAVAAPEDEASSWSSSRKGKWEEKGWRPGGNLGNMFGDGVDDDRAVVVFRSKYSLFIFPLLFWRRFCNYFVGEVHVIICAPVSSELIYIYLMPKRWCIYKRD